MAEPGPLDGVRVIEVGAWVAGPAVGGILADWGADVVKVESPLGDPFRYAASIGPNSENPPFELDNRGKRAIALDIGQAAGRETLDRLLRTADVFLTNLRPSRLESWRLDPASLRDRFPALVVATMTGYGYVGSDRDRPSYDVGGYWARSGLAAAHTVHGEPAMLRSALGDHHSAMSLAGGIAAALLARHSTGHGTHVSTSLLRNGVYGMSQDANFLLRLGRWFPYAREEATNPLFTAYETKDGRWLWLLGLQPTRHWPMIAVALDHSEWLADERFETLDQQRVHHRALFDVIAETISTRTLSEWTPVLDEAQIWWEPVLTLEEVVGGEHFSAIGGLVPVRAPGSTDTVTTVATPVDFDGRSRCNELGPPLLGEHTDEVLQEAGLGAKDIAALRRDGIVG